MARLPRFVLPGHPQHVIVRDNHSNPIFNCDEDYRFYLDKLRDAAKKQQCDILTRVLITDTANFIRDCRFGFSWACPHSSRFGITDNSGRSN